MEASRLQSRRKTTPQSQHDTPGGYLFQPNLEDAHVNYRHSMDSSYATILRQVLPRALIVEAAIQEWIKSRYLINSETIAILTSLNPSMTHFYSQHDRVAPSVHNLHWPKKHDPQV
jgi:hypothetical protein